MSLDNERSACPDHEELASYLDGRLATEEKDAVEAHLLECANCRAVVVDAGAIADEHTAAADPSDP